MPSSLLTSDVQEPLRSNSPLAAPIENCGPVIADAAFVVQSIGSPGTLRMTILSKYPSRLRIELGFYDEHHDELLAHDGLGALRVFADSRLRPYWAAPESSQLARVMEALDSSVLYGGSCRLRIPLEIQDQAFDVGMWVARLHESPDSRRRDLQQGCYYVERPARRMCLGRNPLPVEYGYLLTYAQIEARIHKLAARLPGGGQKTSEALALSVATFRLYGGYDTPLLADE